MAGIIPGTWGAGLAPQVGSRASRQSKHEGWLEAALLGFDGMAVENRRHGGKPTSISPGCCWGI